MCMTGLSRLLSSRLVNSTEPRGRRRQLQNGDVVLTYAAAGIDEIKHWIYTWLPHVEIVELVWFRQRVAEELSISVRSHLRYETFGPIIKFASNHSIRTWCVLQRKDCLGGKDGRPAHDMFQGRPRRNTDEDLLELGSGAFDVGRAGEEEPPGKLPSGPL
jgi:hypothetical protein